MSIRGAGRPFRLLTIAAVLLCTAGCQTVLPPIRQRGAWLVVENQTSSAWKDVTVTLNAYYRGVSPAAGSKRHWRIS